MQTSPMHPHACPRTNNSGDRSCLISERMMLTCATCTDQMYEWLFSVSVLLILELAVKSGEVEGDGERDAHSRIP